MSDSKSAAWRRKVTGIREKVAGSRLVRDFHSFGQAPQYRKVGEADAAKSGDAEDSERPVEYFYRSLYLPNQGMFCQLPKDLQLGQRLEVIYLILCDILCNSTVLALQESRVCKNMNSTCSLIIEHQKLESNWTCLFKERT